MCDGSAVYRIRLQVRYDAAAVDLNNVQLDLRYPAGASLPGSGHNASVRQRLHPLIADAIVAANDKDSNADGIDDTVTIIYASTSDALDTLGDGLRPGAQLEVSFDCANGARIAADDFRCTVTGAFDLSSAPLGDVQCSVGVGGRDH